ncbi:MULTISPECIES: GTPase ObgE [Selenomonas]|uniref:GTPase Obg n=1 Tax=Selenomonas ruminis TaxID=2593411 RepID=A0A5D6W0W5_9FIRM|nr:MULTISPECIES: GTPase ObgE [unclassified Selenomonas]MBQ1868198.1 GTPase ObgE [Selenomonas sp.]TYZ21092.1 GTPase ObgE [Selenomonas sp. mPRGC5]
MQFIDRTKVICKAGDGGHGKSAFRREKFVPNGGPSGGDGGRGGDVIFVVDPNMNTLLDFRFHRKFNGKNGENGDIKNQYGANAPACYVKVPAGTIVKDEETGEVLADLTEIGQEAVICKGGRGGRGNAKFANSANRAPTFAEFGEPGEARNLILELKLLADVGLVGYPSVGKSSLVASCSAARPEIAEYHFTTITPVLGVVKTDYEKSFVMADIPGLIEGAADGVGLGHDFLRHVERTKLILHIVDASGLEGRDPVEDYYKINAELKKYSEKIARRTQILVANKMDIPEAAENIPRLKKLAEEEGLKFFEISAATRQGVAELISYVGEWLDNYVEEPETEDDVKVYDENAEDPEKVTISRDISGDFVVSGKSLEKLVAMTNFLNDEAVRRFQYIWRIKGIDSKLKAKGIKEGDTVHIGAMEFEFRE